ncbi:hypothetical protein PT7_0328 [Pusillimonas sp. T7-7]|uniref:hypothetical protein n=1 Tax=Pusillimonas sp. (strain T7-7) TaxID=1007105 RepID=UPI0002084C53|nr:hypothetical protein [Pusillimonas sp. T7-7]AEC18868.1 hypothetical protein PT7_0328 [Pusillimonas sp. T7-7]
MVNKSGAAGVALLILALWGPALAQPPESGTAAVTVSDLDAIMQEEILLKAKAARAKQQAEFDRYVDEAEAGGRIQVSLPQVAWRRSTASGWLAKFVMADGAAVIAGRGEKLPGGYEVSHIDQQGVKVRRNDELFELSGAASSSRSADAPTRAESLPGLPGAFPLPPQ